MAEYILRADTSEGPVYYMNFITVTSLRINARPFKTKEEAEKNIDRFKMLFYYEKPNIVIEEL